MFSKGGEALPKSCDVPLLGKNTLLTSVATQEGDRGVRGNLDHVSWKMVFLPFIALIVPILV